MTALVVALAALILAGAAIWSGYPLAFYDSGDYIAMSFTFEPLVYRTVPYALFLRATHWDVTLWGAVAAQALVTAWALRETLAAFAPGRGPLAPVGAAAALALLTALPWYAGQIMPDALLAPMVLAIAVLGFGAPLPRVRRLVLCGIALLGAVSHLSHLALALGLLAVALLARARWREIAAAVAGALVAVPAMHFALTGRAFYSEAGAVFVLARMMQDGLVQEHLQRACPEAGYALCRYRGDLPPRANDFLWGHQTWFHELGGWTGFREEAGRVVRDAARADPLAHLAAALRNAAQQVVTLRAGEGLYQQWQDSRDAVDRWFPHEADDYRAARQHRELLGFEAINAVQVPLALLAMLACALLAVRALARQDRAAAGFGVIVLAALLGNALICGALSNPSDRYQSRIAWLPMFYCLVLASAAGAGGRKRLV